MPFSQPTNPLSVELAKLTIRLYDRLRRAGAKVSMVCSRTPNGMHGGSRSKYLHIEGLTDTIRISDHRLPNHFSGKPMSHDVVVMHLNNLPAAEAAAIEWIEQNYDTAQIQTA